METPEPIRTPLGVLRDGMPDQIPIAHHLIAFQTTDGRVEVHMIRTENDQENLARPQEEQAIEVVAAFTMQRPLFLELFGQLLTQVQETEQAEGQVPEPVVDPHADMPACWCGSGLPVTACHGKDD